MTAVVTCRSSVGGSPIIPALSTPPIRGCSCAATAGTKVRIARATSAARRMIMGVLSERLDVRATFPGQGLERHFGLGAVLETHHHGLLEHAEGAHLARHAPLPAAVGLAGRADLGQVLAQLVVRGKLVEQAALEPAAVAEEPAVRERHVLRLGHLHRDGVELLEIRRAAELAPAGADPIQELGRVGRADLAHRDARVELVGEVAHEVPEVYAVLRVEQHGDATVPGIDLHVHYLEPEPPPPGAPAADLGVLELAIAAITPLRHFRIGGATHHLPVEPTPLELGQRALRPPDLADGRALACLHNDEVAHGEVLVVRQMVLGLERHAHPYADEVRQLRYGLRRQLSVRSFAHGRPYAAFVRRLSSTSTVRRGET